MEIRRFGIGHRRHEGPAGTHGVDGQTIHADERGVIAELAFRPNSAMAPHSNPNLTYFVVIEGGGFVQVGDERARVAAGEAIVWPPGVVHAAWTEQTPMRALVVEFPVAPEARLLLEGGAHPVPEPAAVEPAAEPAAVEPAAVEPAAEPAAVEPAAVEPAAAEPADGRLARVPAPPPADRISPEREPW